ncbi:hypothetical protein Gogos_009691 [Gossypium gossypioides]|uniref:F-box associated beta-propeller type 1 domain-containing protein n=1 Tax=Gossypium gossypioides TaxID=34282 RepID=A0A7J9BJ20_GOSGO|nr:hypothetical protein [Gossypium gossypioides]
MVQSHGNNDEYFHSEAKVYSLRSNCWRRIKDVCFYLKFNREFGFLANNALHWMVFKTPQSDNRNLVGFNLGSEEFRFLELPDFCLDKLFWFGTKAMGGDLCLTATYREINNVVVDVWIMKEYGVKQSWIKSISWNEPHNISDSPLHTSGVIWSKGAASLCGMIWEAKGLRMLGIDRFQLHLMWTCLLTALSLLIVMLNNEMPP